MATDHPTPFASTPTSKPPAVDPDSLPPAQSPDLKLEQASLLEYVQTAYLNADEWKGPLSIENYLQREDALQAVDLTRDGRITGWILTSDSLPKNPDGSRPIFASCESIPKHAYMIRDGAFENVTVHGVASVYTRPEYRGKGYAGRMMSELGKKLETWQSVDGSVNPFSVLFSDIGQTYYAKFGWKLFQSTHIHLPPMDPTTYSSKKSLFGPVEDLSLDDLRQIPCDRYQENRLRRLLAREMDGSSTIVSIRADLEHFQWHFARDEFQTKIMGKDFPSVKGAIHRGSGLGLIWCRVYAAKKEEWQLHILHTICPPSAEIDDSCRDAMCALLLRAQLEAHEWEMLGGVS